MIMIGGVKGKTKIPLLHALLPVVDTIMITAPLCFTFFKALNKETGLSYTEPTMVEDARRLLEEAAVRNVLILFPIDFQVTTASFQHPKKIRLAKNIQSNETALSVGPETTHLFKKTMRTAQTLFINGLPGNPLYEETLESSRIILSNLQSFSGTCVIGGGDSVDLVQQLGFADVGYLSTGGGATLTYLSKEPLPALIMLIK